MGIWGMVSLLNNRATNYSIPLMRKPNLFITLLVWLAFPFYVIQNQIITEMHNISVHDHPLRLKKISDEKILLKSKTWNFHDLQKVYK